MGINMPCKTVVFTGDSIYLSALNYRQASGRAGRRGFDVLGNVVFHNIPPHRVFEIISAKLPDLRGQFPTSVSLILRLFILLHGTNNSPFAAGALKALLTQNWLYVGGPDAKMSIIHHLRFSIEYLRRQSLISETGAPVNFAGLISHLYYTESAAFAFHALLRGGYFHHVCADFRSNMNPTQWSDMARQLVLTLSHLFVRVPFSCGQSQKAALPSLPAGAHAILQRHNADILHIYRDYVRSYVARHLADVQDDMLPFTGFKIKPLNTVSIPLPHSLPEVTIRSPFTALSGFTDSDFSTVDELCRTVRAGVPLEASAVPSILLDDERSKSNSYLLDFFKHGDNMSLERDNGIHTSDLWFRLKDFSLVLASIVTSLEGFLQLGSAGIDISDDEIIDWGHEDSAIREGWAVGTQTEQGEVHAGVGVVLEKRAAQTGKKKAMVVDSWEDEDEEVSSSAETVSGLEGSDWGDDASDAAGLGGRSDDGQSLMKVYRALRQVQCEFDEKFYKIGA